MTTRTMEALYDSESTLRLVDRELEALREFTGGVDEAGAPASALAMVPRILQRANAEIATVLQSLRQCRSQLASATADKLQITHEKLREVTSATEVAATDILDGLDRAQALVDEMDAETVTSGDTPNGPALRERLRDELFVITGCLQFQDITNQQLTYASTVLVEMETRLAEIASLLDPQRYGMVEATAAVGGPAPSVTYSPDATCVSAEERQRVADAIFTQRRAAEG